MLFFSSLSLSHQRKEVSPHWYAAFPPEMRFLHTSFLIFLITVWKQLTCVLRFYVSFKNEKPETQLFLIIETSSSSSHTTFFYQSKGIVASTSFWNLHAGSQNSLSSFHVCVPEDLQRLGLNFLHSRLFIHAANSSLSAGSQVLEMVQMIGVRGGAWGGSNAAFL